MVPAFYNYDFGDMAEQMGLKYLISLGGEVPDHSVPPEVSECQDDLLACDSDGACFGQAVKTLLQKCFVAGRPYKEFSASVKHLDFNADLVSLEKSLQKALTHLHSSCGTMGRCKAVIRFWSCCFVNI